MSDVRDVEKCRLSLSDRRRASRLSAGFSCPSRLARENGFLVGVYIPGVDTRRCHGLRDLRVSGCRHTSQAAVRGHHTMPNSQPTETYDHNRNNRCPVCYQSLLPRAMVQKEFLLGGSRIEELPQHVKHDEGPYLICLKQVGTTRCETKEKVPVVDARCVIA